MKPPAPVGVQHLRIDAHAGGQRLDNFLIRTLKGVPKSRIYRIVRRGEVRVNGGRVAPDYRLRPGDMVRIPPVRQSSREPLSVRPFGLSGRILYRDARLLVLDKPPGVAVHAGSGVPAGLIEGLRAHGGELARAELVHRLDRETSGCLLIALDREALVRLHGDFAAGGRVRKHYLALCCGAMATPRAVLDAPLGGTGPGSSTREARTELRRVRGFSGGQTLVVARLLTGRTHQARIHLAGAGLAVAGDPRYGERDCNRQLRALGLRRMFLHASRLCFPHPESAQRVCVHSPLPEELRDFLTQLERPAGNGT
ncbi:MAG: RluA family pseudouridine synthase [Gammaproteobacteria bacterium]|jgi:23S rRNA pseudouridine955/2504/2580 synthase|nr:RluA family pseudouridine synthase [Gammaproteobacteria bacterium]